MGRKHSNELAQPFAEHQLYGVSAQTTAMAP
jgi:hypothetical protein